MVRLVDRTNQRFGELLVLRRGPNQPRADGKSHRTTWTCQCDCGKICNVEASKLIRKVKPQRTCGHTQAFNDLSGRVFEQMTVEPGKWRRTEHGVEWRCKCSCGRSKPTWHRADHLLSNSVRKCDLCGREATRNARLIPLENLTFGRLTVVRRESEEWGQAKVRWLCQCSCGNPELVPVIAQNLTRGKTQSCGCIASGWDSPTRFVDEPDHASCLTNFYVVEVRKTFLKFGIADDVFKRSKNNGDGNDYSKFFLKTELPRADAWAVEQVCLFRTREQWQPAKIRSEGMAFWPGWTELRFGVDPKKAVSMAKGLITEVREIGWLELLKRHAPVLLPEELVEP